MQVEMYRSMVRDPVLLESVVQCSKEAIGATADTSKTTQRQEK